MFWSWVSEQSDQENWGLMKFGFIQATLSHSNVQANKQSKVNILSVLHWQTVCDSFRTSRGLNEVNKRRACLTNSVVMTNQWVPDTKHGGEVV